MRRLRSLVFFFFFCVATCLAVPVSAQLASRSAEEWIKSLESPQRIESLKNDETPARLTLKPGNIVAGVGAGSGVFEAPLAHAASPGGNVYAVAVGQRLLDPVHHGA